MITSMQQPIIRIEQAVVAYHDSVALNGVSLTIVPGEFVAVIGPNGAGKTTLLTIINGLTRLVKGRLEVFGQSIDSWKRAELRKKVGYIAQAEAIDRRMPVSVRESVMIGRYGNMGLFKGPDKQEWSHVHDALAMVGMAHLANRPVGHLSGGEYQRAAIARCLVQEPGLFLLDEPTASLDWKAQTEILQLVRRIHDERKLTTLFVTHDLDALPHTCDRVVLMKEGLITGDGSPEQLITADNLSRLFDLPATVVAERHTHVHSGR
jgi:ABC-type cobalamin/Fe3+-siderophores transport system ATPase subunit